MRGWEFMFTAVKCPVKRTYSGWWAHPPVDRPRSCLWFLSFSSLPGFEPCSSGLVTHTAVASSHARCRGLVTHAAAPPSSRRRESVQDGVRGSLRLWRNPFAKAGATGVSFTSFISWLQGHSRFLFLLGMSCFTRNGVTASEFSLVGERIDHSVLIIILNLCNIFNNIAFSFLILFMMSLIDSSVYFCQLYFPCS